jgi:hypothetical protein
METNEPKIELKPEAPKKGSRLWLIAIPIVIILVVGGAFAYDGYFDKYLKKDKAAETTTDDSDVATSATKSDGDTDVADQSVAGDDAVTAGYELYKNYLNKYRIEYPSGATVEDFSDPVADSIENSGCLKISTENYYVLIGTKPTEETATACFRTGVGSDWTNGPSDTLTAAGMEYTTNGMHTEAASAGYYQDFFMIQPVDNRVSIEYGTSVNEKYGTISKQAAKDLVHSIIATYNPAE